MKTLDDALQDFIFSDEAELFIQIVWDNAIEACAEVCDESDKSTHPSDLADTLRTMKSGRFKVDRN